jgi:hypothetical protein
MRILATTLIVLALVATAAPAFADSIPTHSRYVEYKVFEPCGVVVTSGEVHLEWADCGGDVEQITLDVPDYDHPLELLFYAGCPDWSAISAQSYDMFFCHKCCHKQPDIYCADCDPCCWYCYKTEVCWCGETVCARTYLPTCMALEITDVY